MPVPRNATVPQNATVPIWDVLSNGHGPLPADMHFIFNEPIMFESSRLLEEWLAGERFAYWAIFFLYFYSYDILSSQEQTLEDFKGKVTLKPTFK